MATKVDAWQSVNGSIHANKIDAIKRDLSLFLQSEESRQGGPERARIYFITVMFTEISLEDYRKFMQLINFIRKEEGNESL